MVSSPEIGSKMTIWGYFRSFRPLEGGREGQREKIEDVARRLFLLKLFTMTPWVPLRFILDLRHARYYMLAQTLGGLENLLDFGRFYPFWL